MLRMIPRVTCAGRWACWCAALLMCADAVWAQAPRVPYVPTPHEVVERMLQMAKVTANDYLIDLGSGDGRIVVTAAAQLGARGFGVDINPLRVTEALENARKAGVTDKAAFYQRDLFQTDLSQATVITMYLLPRVNMELRPKLLDLKPGTRIVSHDFSLDDWKPDASVRLDVKEKYGNAGGQSEIFFWVVPAKVAGHWRWELPAGGTGAKGAKARIYEVVLEQTFQMLTGRATVGGRDVPLQHLRLAGEEIGFSITADLGAGPVKHEFKGRVEGEHLGGSAALSGARSQGHYEWNATRAPRTQSTTQR